MRRTEGVRTLIIILNGTCNLRCKYCFINKDNASIFNNITKDLVDKIETGFYPEKLMRLMPDKIDRDKIQSIDFWGGEPTLNLMHGFKAIEQLIQICENIRVIHISTNFSLPDVADRFVTFCQNLTALHKSKHLSKPFVIMLQISVDGSPNINDRNRGDSVSSKIFENFKMFADKINTITSSEHCIVKIHTHGVTDSESISKFADDIDNIRDFIDYHHQYAEYLLHNKIPAITDKYRIECKPSCTMAFFSPETRSSGVIAAHAMENFYRFWDMGNKYHYDKDFWDTIVGWHPGKNGMRYDRVKTIFKNRFASKAEAIIEANNTIEKIENHIMPSTPQINRLCGMGTASHVLSPTDKYPICQNVYFDQYPEYLEQFKDINAPNSGYIKQENDSYENLSKNWVFGSLEDYKYFMNITTTAYETFSDQGYYGDELLCRSYIKLAAECGIVDSKYLDEKERNYAARIVNDDGECMSHMLQVTGSIYVPIMNYIPFYLNGALDWIDKLTIMQLKGYINYDK